MNTKENNEIFLNELKKLSQKNISTNAFDKLKELTENNNDKKNIIFNEKLDESNEKINNNIKKNNTGFKEQKNINENEIVLNENINHQNKLISNENNNQDKIISNENINNQEIKNNLNENSNDFGLKVKQTTNQYDKTNEQSTNSFEKKLELEQTEKKDFTNKPFLISKEKNEQSNEKNEQPYSWEKNNDLLTKNSFQEEVNKEEETKPNNENEQKETSKYLQFDWEKRKDIIEPKPENFQVTKTNYDWLKNQIKDENQSQEENKLNSINPKNQFNEKLFDLKKYDISQEPLEENFLQETNQLNQNNDTQNKLNQPITAKWLKNKKEEPIMPKQTGEIKRPVWIKNKKENLLEENEDVTNYEKIISKTEKNLEEENNTKNDTLYKKPKWLKKNQSNTKENEKTEEKGNASLNENETLTKNEEKEKINDNKENNILNEKDETTLEKKWSLNKGELKKPKWLKQNKSKPKENEFENITNSLNEKKEEPRTLTIAEQTTANENNELVKVKKLKTFIDEMFEILEKNKIVTLDNIAKSTGMDYYKLEQVAKMFEDYGIIDLKYSTSLKAKAKITLKKEVIPKIKEIPKGKILNDYSIEVDFVPAEIRIVEKKDENRPIYSIDMPSIGKYTKKFLEFIKTEIAESMPIELDEILDPKKSKHLKKRFFEESQKQLKKYFTNSNEEILNILSGTVLHEMYGLGPIEVILGDDMLEEVAINSSKTPIAVYHRIHGWMKTNLYPGTEEEIMNYASQIGRKIGREITILKPILDAHLLSGDRVNATLFPISAEGNTLTIRRFARKPWTLIDFIGKAHTMSSEMASLLWLAMQYEMNIIISGGTASGKTSALNILLALVPSYHRIISIEDVREIILPVYLTWNWIPLITRSANPEGLGEVTMLDCMVSSLRMRPDRIIVGEIRRKKEAEVMMEAIETGHSIYSTIHANSAYQVLRRLAEPPMAIPIMQIELIDLIVVQFRDRKTNKRRTFEIAEVEQASAGKGLQINTIYKWVPRTDTWDQLNKPTKLLTTLNQHTGLTEDEIYKELEERTHILNWLQSQNINDLDEIGFIIKLFYTDPQRVKKMAKDNITKEQIEKMIE
ncbi:MAG: ATPase, T2SS/T4P/T4SS family [Candidatus ainarchaeum sp.]|nr:ATPase, T2SS/T4P/T4SS family [Candidatus ainarchaeum sp.]